MNTLSPVTNLVKRVAWSRLYNWDFSNFGEFATDQPPQTVSTATAAWTPAGLTAGSVAIGSGGVVQQQLSAGAANTLYTGSCTITTSGGATLVMGAQLSVVA